MDDVWRRIFLLLPCRDLRNVLLVSKHWHDLPDELFWKYKVNIDYHFLGAFIRNKSPRERYYAFMSGINASILFEHHRDENQLLYAKIKLNKLLKGNAELSLLVVIFGIEEYEVETYEWRSESVKRYTSDHRGDCINMACTCISCYFEDGTRLGLKLLNNWWNIYDISIFDIACIIASVQPLHYARYSDRAFAGQQDCSLDYETYPFIEMTPQEHLQHWLGLSDKQQEDIKIYVKNIIKKIDA